MLPTLNGRLQTRIFMLVVFGSIITFLITPILPDGAPGTPGFNGDFYRVTFIILATVLVLGIIWELIYHVIQQFRWEKDWPTLFGLITAINEGALVWLLLGQRPDPRDAAGARRRQPAVPALLGLLRRLLGDLVRDLDLDERTDARAADPVALLRWKDRVT